MFGHSRINSYFGLGNRIAINFICLCFALISFESAGSGSCIFGFWLFFKSVVEIFYYAVARYVFGLGGNLSEF